MCVFPSSQSIFKNTIFRFYIFLERIRNIGQLKSKGYTVYMIGSKSLYYCIIVIAFPVHIHIDTHFALYRNMFLLYPAKLFPPRFCNFIKHKRLPPCSFFSRNICNATPRGFHYVATIFQPLPLQVGYILVSIFRSGKQIFETDFS